MVLNGWVSECCVELSGWIGECCVVLNGVDR